LIRSIPGMWPDSAHAVLTIDLRAVVANWRLLQAKHSSGVTGAVVKADGYGLGAVPIATALAEAGCRVFFVATPAEAFALRDIIPGADLILLGGLFAGTEAECAARDVFPALGSLEEIENWSRVARHLGRALPAFLHFDTGMSRLGLDARECAILAEDHGRLDGIDVRAVMSHLVSSEIPDDPINGIQRDWFVAGKARLPPAPASLVNSAGIFLDETFGFDLARPGSALFGVNPTPGRSNPMHQVAALSARVLSVRDIPKGATVGYSATWTAARACRIATVGVGYADGWHRRHSNTGAAYFDGHPVPLVGRVSMDLTTFDVTDLPAVRPGSWLELLGPHRTVDEAAVDAGTIGYEVLTSLGRRFHRHYLPA
jgi:alanine racemase